MSYRDELQQLKEEALLDCHVHATQVGYTLLPDSINKKACMLAVMRFRKKHGDSIAALKAARNFMKEHE